MPQKTYIYAGWLIDGTTMPVQKNVWICISGGLIESIHPAQANVFFEGNPEAICLDLSEFTVMPCLIDCHVHLFMSGTDDIAVRKLQLDADYNKLESVIATHIDHHIACGVGAVRDGGDNKGLSLQYKHERVINSAASSKNFHLKVAGKAWHQAGRYGKLIGTSPNDGETLAEAIDRQIRGDESDCPDHIKVVNSGVNSLICFGKETLPQFSLEDLRSAVIAASARNLKVMVHANGRLPVQIAVEAGCHSIEHGFFMEFENLARMRDKQTFWTPTMFTMRAYACTLKPFSREADTAQRNLDHQLEQLQKARELGVLAVLGTDAGSLGVHHGHAVREELRLFLEAGYTISEAVHGATQAAAALLGIPDRGTITPGMPPFWIAVKGSPSSLPDSLERVFTENTLKKRMREPSCLQKIRS